VLISKTAYKEVNGLSEFFGGVMEARVRHSFRWWVVATLVAAASWYLLAYVMHVVGVIIHDRVSAGPWGPPTTVAAVFLIYLSLLWGRCIHRNHADWKAPALVAHAVVLAIITLACAFFGYFFGLVEELSSRRLAG
jgi:hypothetical protein